MIGRPIRPNESMSKNSLTLCGEMLYHLTECCVISWTVVLRLSPGVMCHLKECCVNSSNDVLFCTQWKCCGARDFNDYDDSLYRRTYPDNTVGLRLDDTIRSGLNLHTYTSIS